MDKKQWPGSKDRGSNIHSAETRYKNNFCKMQYWSDGGYSFM